MYTDMLGTEITLTKLKKNKYPRGNEVTGGMIKAVVSIGMQWIHTCTGNKMRYQTITQR
jgi:hypothetical protein